MSGRIRNLTDARREVSRLKQELDDTYKRYYAAVTKMPPDFQGDAHKYMCIRFSGYIEQLMHKSITGYIKSSNNQSIANFALSSFKYAPNMKPSQLEILVAKFSNDWQQSLDQLLQKDNNRDNLNALLEIRNKTAHGENYKGSTPQVITYKMLVDDLDGWVKGTILS